MKPKMKLKLAVDISMTVLLLLLMTYELIGQVAHEWFEIGMFVLFILHHILNGKWLRSVRKGNIHRFVFSDSHYNSDSGIYGRLYGKWRDIVLSRLEFPAHRGRPFLCEKPAHGMCL